MADTQALAALLARVEGGTGEDRELDAASHVAMCEPEQYPDDHRRFRLPHPSLDHMDMCAKGTYWLVERSGRSLQTSPRYTSSLDAVIALVERERPGWGRQIHYERSGFDGKRWAWAQLFVDSPRPKFTVVNYSGKAMTEPRALLAALIAAKMEEIAQ